MSRSRTRRPTICSFRVNFSSSVVPGDNEKAIELFNRAIKLDPDYALAWAQLSTGYYKRAVYGSSSIPRDAGKAMHAVERALQIDPGLAYAHVRLAQLRLSFDFDLEGAQAEYKQARALEPNNAKPKIGLAHLAVDLGRIDEGISVYQQVLLRDPLDMDTIWSLGLALLFAGRPEEAAATYRRLVELNPVFAGGRSQLGLALLFMGRPAEALIAAEKEPEEAWKLITLPAAYWALGRRTESDAALGEFTKKYAAGSAYQIAQLHAYRGEVDAAFEWLDRAYRQRDGGIMWIKVDPMLRNLYGNPRYQGLLVKLKLDGNPPAPAH